MECQGEHGFPRTILINPEILGHSPVTAEGWEGCLSVDGLRGKVRRPVGVRVKYLDRDGKTVELDASGLYAICIQHEIDHRSEEHTSELQSRLHLVCRLLLEKKK